MELKKLTLLPPASGRCPQCAVEHEPSEPHDAASMFYGFWFLGQHGRSPTWADAMAHCTPETKQRWTYGLTSIGIDISSANVKGSIKTQSDFDERLTSGKAYPMPTDAVLGDNDKPQSDDAVLGGNNV